MSNITIENPPAFILKDCQTESFFSTSTVSVTTLSR